MHLKKLYILFKVFGASFQCFPRVPNARSGCWDVCRISHGSSPLSITSVPRDPMPFSGICRYCTHMVHSTHTGKTTETDRQTGREGKEETKEEGGEGWGRGIKVRKPYPNAQNQRSKWDLNLGLFPFFLLILYTTLSSTRTIPPPLEKCPSPGPPLSPVRAQPWYPCKCTVHAHPFTCVHEQPISKLKVQDQKCLHFLMNWRESTWLR